MPILGPRRILTFLSSDRRCLGQRKQYSQIQQKLQHPIILDLSLTLDILDIPALLEKSFHQTKLIVAMKVQNSLPLIIRRAQHNADLLQRLLASSTINYNNSQVRLGHNAYLLTSYVKKSDFKRSSTYLHGLLVDMLPK